MRVFSVRLIIYPVLCLLAGALAGANHVSFDQPAQPTAAGNCILSPNDLVDIKVFREDDLRVNARIAKDGTITFPLIGSVRIGGMSIHDASKTICELLEKDYLVNPQVAVSVREYAKRTFTILGQVQRAGAYDFPD